MSAGEAPSSRADARWAYIALGSNLGDSKAIVLRAMEQLQALSDAPLVRSSLWKTEPVDCPPASLPFVNAVVGVVLRTAETPETLLARLQQLEREFGRGPKRTLNEPRPLDLDLIAFAEARFASKTLILPHPRAHLRRFVLQPLAEVAPDLLLPGQTRTVQELLRDLASGESVTRVSGP